MVNLAAGGYAAPQDLVDGLWVTSAPSNAVQLLRSASLRVAEACYRNPYADVPTGGDAEALRDATCAQATVWITSGIDPADVAVSEAALKSSTILDGRVEYDTTAQANARAAAVEGLSPDAVAILTAAGLIYMPVPVADTSGLLPTFGLSGPLPYYGSPLAERCVDAGDWPYW